MDTIRNYLDTMFSSLPDSEEVRRAKQELLMMMEDKYNELISEGKPENEAIGIVISEFGNLNEIAESLGISKDEAANDSEKRRHVSYDEAIDYISDAVTSRFMLALGIMLCTASPIGLIMAGGLDSASVLGIVSKAASGAGLLLLFAAVACGVGLIILSTSKVKKWKFLTNELCSIDAYTVKNITEDQIENQFNKKVMLAAGIALCILSVAPAAIIDSISSNNFLSEGVAPTLLFIMVSVGVFLIISSGAKESAFRTLLSLNGKTGIESEDSEGNVREVRINVEIDNDDKEVKAKKYKKHKKAETGNPLMDAIMGSYWQIVTLIFFVGGFVFGEWGRMWLIWLIAPLVHNILKKAY